MDKKKKHIELNLEESAPVLHSLKKQNNFKIPVDYFSSFADKLSLEKEGIPENYFTEFPDKVMTAIEKDKRKVISIQRKVTYRLTAIAASIMLFISLSIPFWNKDKELASTDNTEFDFTAASLSEALSDMETDNFLAYLKFDEKTKETNNTKTFPETSKETTSDDILESFSSSDYFELEF